MSINGGEALRVLLVEDSEDDALLLTRELQRGGYAPETARVSSASELSTALREREWDVIITDHNMPGFGSQEALQIIRDAAVETPIIIVSGSIGEDIAVASMKAGAHDYIMKGNLARLVPAVKREVREADTRRAHRRAEETIRHLAFHDPLTGLVNRYEFELRLKRAIEDCAIRAKSHALLYLDLDQFKLINDTSGHTAGDELLRQISVVLGQQIRESDTLARLGGDEFGVLLPNCPSDRAREIADKLLRAINDFRFVWAGKSFAIGGSIGLVPITSATTPLIDVLRAADMSCYAAKEQGRNRIHTFTVNDTDMARRHGEMEWATRLRHALDEDRFALFHQMIVPTSDRHDGIARQELLLRLRDENGQLVEPGAFIPAAERFNLMPALDRWVVRNALRHAAQSRGGDAVSSTLYFINLSGASLSDDAFYDFIREELNTSRVPPDNLCFEITETAAIANLSRAVSFIKNIRTTGCHFALDDFGSGLSSFSYLKSIPVDYLKIDGAFVKDIVDDPMDHAIVDAINRIGHVVGLRTIAEFVESKAILEAISSLGVDYAQGYHIHRPAPAWDVRLGLSA
jgi:diguanylate cyclase (GGDEF)-like protein